MTDLTNPAARGKGAARGSGAAAAKALGAAALGVTAACFFVPGPAVGQGAPDDSLRNEVLVELEQYYADFSARDWDRFSSHFWPGATITTVWQPPGEEEDRVVVTPVPDFVARAPEGPGSREIFEERMLEAEVRVSGGLAQAWARYRARFGDPGEVSEWDGTDAFTLLKHDGRWKIVSLVFAPEDQDDRRDEQEERKDVQAPARSR